MNRQDVEAILPLSATQEALLLHATTEQEDRGFVQVRAQVRGELDLSRLQRAWETVVQRHLCLRMSVHAPEGLQPRLVAWRRSETPWASQDLRALSAGERDDALARLVEEDRARGLDLSQPPVSRVLVVRLDDTRHQLVWSCHHLLLDGWSTGIVLRDLAAAYRSLVRGEPALDAPDATYRAYVGWRRKQDANAGEGHWLGQLEGFGTATPLPFDEAPASVERGDQSQGTASLSLDDSQQAALDACVSRAGATASALLTGAWALLLAHHGRSADVAFGSVVSGRAGGFARADEVVGMLSHVVPTRVRIPEDEPLADWLRAIRDRQFAGQPFEHVSIADLIARGGNAARHCVFETLLIFENFPAPDLHLDAVRGVELRHLGSGLTTTYPLTLVAVPGTRWTLRLVYAPERISSENAERLLGQLRDLLGWMAEAPDATLDSITSRMERELERSPRPSGDGSAARRARAATTDATTEAPRSDVERRLAGIWQSLLGLERVGIHDDFFALGGHSLLSMRLIAEIEAEWGVDVPLTAFFRQPTIAQFARLVAGDDAPDPAPDAPGAGAGAELSASQSEALRALHEKISKPVLAPDTRYGFWPGWGRRRRALSLALGQLAYPRSQRLLAAALRWPWLRRAIVGRRIELTRRFLDGIDGGPDDAAVLERCLLSGCLYEYRVGPWGSRAPRPGVAGRHLELEGFERLQRARDDGHGVVLVSCHDNALFWLSTLDWIDSAVGGVHLVLETEAIDDAHIENALLSHQLDVARRTLRRQGVVSVAGDGHHGASAGIEHAFHGRRRPFRTGFAELALGADASVFVALSAIDPSGAVRMRLEGPLDPGDATWARERRIRHLVDQFVSLYRDLWTRSPWMVPWTQMERHLAFPPLGPDEPRD